MKKQSENKASSNFLKTEGGKTKSISIEVPSISLPKGSGAIKGIDEKFYVIDVNSTALFSNPLPFSPTRDPSSILMKYLLSIFFVFFNAFFAFAQSDPPITPPPLSAPNNPTLVIFIGFDFNKPNSNGKENSYLLDAKGINISLYKPLIKKKTLSFGLNAGTDYTISKKDQVATLPNPYHVAKETSSEVVFNSFRTPSKFPPGSPRGTSQVGFKLEVGPQFDFYFGKRLVFSPIFQLGYLSLVQNEFIIMQTTRLNGLSYNYNILSQSQTKTSGLSIAAKLRVQYYFTRSFDFWAEANYIMGPTIKNTVSTFSPEGSPDVNGQYTFPQMQSGTIKTEVRETKYNVAGVNFGLAIRITDKATNDREK